MLGIPGTGTVPVGSPGLGASREDGLRTAVVEKLLRAGVELGRAGGVGVPEPRPSEHRDPAEFDLPQSRFKFCVQLNDVMGQEHGSVMSSVETAHGNDVMYICLCT